MQGPVIHTLELYDKSRCNIHGIHRVLHFAAAHLVEAVEEERSAEGARAG